jgi:cyclophilin family peptidyl-prolyl cis-trans isomerase
MKHRYRLLLFVVVIGVLCSDVTAQTVFTGKPQYQLEIHRADTVMGTIIVEMFPAIAPNHVRNWDSLVSIHFYDSTAFHRVIPGFMIQGGDPNSRSGDQTTWGYGDSTQRKLNAEFSSVSHQRGILSAARTNDPNSATSQFFICIASPTSLDRQYSVYGHVVSGMKVADSIVAAARDANNDPLVKISMFITRLGSNDSVTSVPSLVSPADGSSNGNAVKATLKWHKVPDAMLYRLQVATDANFTTIVRDSGLRQIDTSCTVTKLSPGATYYWRVLANNGGNPSTFSDPWKFDIWDLGVPRRTTDRITMLEVSPSPVRGDAEIKFSLLDDDVVRLRIYDILGRMILAPIESQWIPSGLHQVAIPAGSLMPGSYECRLEASGVSVVRRIVVQ